MTFDPRLHRVYHLREPHPLTVEIHDDDCDCPACAPYLPAPNATPAEPPALTLQEIGARVWAGLAIGTAIAFAYDARGAAAALLAIVGR